MAKDVFIIPSEGLVQFSSSAGSGSGKIQSDGDDIVISNALGDVLLGDGTSDVFIGDGTNNVDIVFEQNGEIKDDGSGKNIIFGSKTTNVFISGSNTVALQSGGGNVGIGTTTAGTELEVVGSISQSITSTGSFGSVHTDGNVGIGTTSPSMELEVVVPANGGILVNRHATTLQSSAEVGFRHTTSEGDAALGMRSVRTNEQQSYDHELKFFTTAGGTGSNAEPHATGQNEHMFIKHSGKIGIGHGHPTALLHISGTTSTNNLFKVTDSNQADILVITSSGTAVGKVGIGTMTPQNPLSVSGSLSVFTSNNTSRLTVGEADDSGVASSNILAIEVDGVNNKSHTFTVGTGNDYIIETLGNKADVHLSAKGSIKFGINNGSAYNFTEKMMLTGSTGNLGIGTSTPGEKLEVVGNISASGAVTASAFKGDGTGLSNVSATVADESITLAKLAHAAANTVMVRDANSEGDPSFKAVTNTQILIGDGTGFTAAALSGDVTMTNGGVVTIGANAVEGSMLNTNVAGTGLTVAGNNIDVDAAQTQITSVGTLTGLFVDSHITASGNISASGDIITTGTGSFNDLISTTHLTVGNNISASGNFHTLGGVVNTDEVRSVTQTTNKLILEDDQDLATNMVSLMSVNFLNLIADGNNNGTGKVRILDGNYDIDSATEVAEFSPEGIDLNANITASGNISSSGAIQSTGNISTDGAINATSADFGDGNIANVGVIDLDTIRGDGDTNTNIAFTTDQITFKAGNEVLLTLQEGDASGRDIVTIGDGGDVDFKVRANGDDNAIFVQGSSDNVGIGTTVPPKKLTVEGSISASGDIFIGESILSSSGNYLGNRQFNKTSTTDADHSGDIVYIGGTTSMDNGKIYHYKSDGTWELADADAAANCDGLLAVALGAASDINGMLLRGTVTLDHDPGAVGDVLFLATGGTGQATATAPSGNTDIVRVVGYCLDASNGQIWFNPDNTFVEVSA